MHSDVMRRGGSRSLRRIIMAASAAAALALGGFVLWRANAPAASADAGDPKLVAEGRVVYEQRCAACHGAHLEGQPGWQERLANGRLPAPPHDASGHTWHHSDAQLFAITREGPAALAPGYASDMPAFKDVLSDHEIRAVLAYIKSTWPPAIRERQEAINRAAHAAHR